MLVAAIGAFATYVYNRRQQQATAADAARQLAAEDARADRELAVRRVQTIQTFFPHLKSDDDRDAALLAINALGDHELANQLALTYGGQTSFGALLRIAASAPGEASERATASLATVVDTLRSSVVKVVSADTYGAGFVVTHDGVVATANYILDAEVDLRVQFANGEAYPVSVLYRGATRRDAALLKIPADLLEQVEDVARLLPSLRLTDEPPVIGDEVVTFGFPGSGGDPVSVGVITDFLPAHDEVPGLVLARIRTEGGFSGAPYVLRNGKVVAVHGGVTLNPDGTRTAVGISAAEFAKALSLRSVDVGSATKPDDHH